MKTEIKSELLQEGVFSHIEFDRTMKGMLLAEVESYVDDIFAAYINERLNSGQSAVPDFHNFIFAFYNDEKKARILDDVIQFRIFNPFTEDLLSHLEAKHNLNEERKESVAGAAKTTGDGGSSRTIQEVLFAVEHYRGIQLYEQTGPETEEDWTPVFDHLYRAYRIRPLRTDTGILREAAKKTGNKRVLFEISAYDYYNREEKNFFRRTALFLRYIITPGKTGGFRSELESVRKKLRSDLNAEIERSTPENLPGFEPVQLYSFEDGIEISVNPSDPAPPIENVPFILSFFSTNCGYCVEELLALQKLLQEAEETGKGNSFAVLPVSAERLNLDEFTVSILEFSDRFGFTINFFQNPASDDSLPERYGIRNVPVMLLFNESGTPLAWVQYHSMGHLELKIRWLVEDYFNITL